MPIPAPQSNESRIDFMNRCMSDSTMESDFPQDDQRFAVCAGTWADNKAIADALKET